MSRAIVKDAEERGLLRPGGVIVPLVCEVFYVRLYFDVMLLGKEGPITVIEIKNPVRNADRKVVV